jgi:hypothetical protein
MSDKPQGPETFESDEERDLNNVSSRQAKLPEDVTEKLIAIFVNNVNRMPALVSFEDKPYEVEIHVGIDEDNVMDDLKFHVTQGDKRISLGYTAFGPEAGAGFINCIDGNTIQEAYDFIRGIEIEEPIPTSSEVSLITNNLRQAAGLPARIYPDLDINEQLPAVVAKLKDLTDDWVNTENKSLRFQEAHYTVDIKPDYSDDESIRKITVCATPDQSSGHGFLDFMILINEDGTAEIMTISQNEEEALTFVKEAQKLEGAEAVEDRRITQGALKMQNSRHGFGRPEQRQAPKLNPELLLAEQWDSVLARAKELSGDWLNNTNIPLIFEEELFIADIQATTNDDDEIWHLSISTTGKPRQGINIQIVKLSDGTVDATSQPSEQAVLQFMEKARVLNKEENARYQADLQRAFR